MSVVVLLNRNCRACGAVFCVCSHCAVGYATAAKRADEKPGGNSYERPIDVTSGPTQTAPDAPARLSAAEGRCPRDGSWFPCDRFTGLGKPQ